MVARVFKAGEIAVNAKIRRLHLLIHSSGGVITDGIAIYNFLRNLPLDITTYNAGGVSSVAVLPYLAGKNRQASKAATFLIHKSAVAPPAATAERLKLTAEYLLIEDGRSEDILREHITLPPEKWEIHSRGDLTLTAEEAVRFGLAHVVGDWVPPAGATVSTI